MVLRPFRERVVQTLSYEAGGLLVATPLYSLLFGAPGSEGFVLVLLMSVAVMIWTPAYNTVFDWIEARATGRVASDRPHGLRVVHAAGLEAGSVLVTLPVIIGVTGLGLWHAILLDLGFTLFYMGYSYLFHLVYDRLRPVRQAGPAGPAGPAR